MHFTRFLLDPLGLMLARRFEISYDYSLPIKFLVRSLGIQSLCW
jgi:hypothetical protein